VEDIKNKHPESHIIFSSLLPRTDALDEKVNDLNNKLEKAFSSKKNITLVQHNNIYKNGLLKDKKHLNNIGVKRFAQNLKRAFFRKNISLPQQHRQYRPPRPPTQWFPHNAIPPQFPSILPYTPNYHFNNAQSPKLLQTAPPKNTHLQHPNQDHPPNFSTFPSIHHNQTARLSTTHHTTQETKTMQGQLIQLIKDLQRYVSL
jgi:UDP:flavonoid glycosyltransferase YjiC (YdhE family)